MISRNLSWMTLAAASLALAGPGLAQSAPIPLSVPLPGWMAGGWEMQDGLRWTDEFWLPPRGEKMIGGGQSGFGRELEQWETTRIERKTDGSLSYVAQSKGGKVTEFAMTLTSDQTIEFANPTHDYPQRIRYWREGNLLMAEISKMDGSNAQRWNYRPLGQ